MTGRKTLREIREQLTAAKAAVTPSKADPAAVLETLDRLADELRNSQQSFVDPETPTTSQPAAPGASPVQ
jgi:hypothetical protein